jgi:hypothetical protein
MVTATVTELRRPGYPQQSLYWVDRHPLGWALRQHVVRSDAPPAIDVFRTFDAASYALRMLENGSGCLDRHASLGCRVVER